jgi:hypothetical protein
MGKIEMNGYLLNKYSKLVAEITGGIVYFAQSNGLDEKQMLEMAGSGLMLMSKADYSEFEFSNGNILKSMTNDELAEWIHDILFENSGTATYDIPSPLGGYMAQEVIDTDDINNVLEEGADL